MSATDVQKLIDRIMSDERFRSSSAFSDKVYRDEPIIKTGRQMASYLPDEYRRMRKVSRWEQGPEGKPGRWLSEAELFYRQGMLMADVEDDCPYHGTFKPYYPTYNAMSDRQLRGYFTWRTRVRHGDIEETTSSFALVYLYELVCGIGVDDPREGFDELKRFWEVYREFDPVIERNGRSWLQDYVVYHGLPAELLSDSKTVQFDRALDELRHAAYRAEHAMPQGSGGRGKTAPALPLPPADDIERPLFQAIDELSTYRIGDSKLAGEHLRDVRHVACAVFVRMAEYYRKHRKNGMVETFFGEVLSMPYTMFASAVFFNPTRHPDTEYVLGDRHRYRCENGFWTCERVHGNRGRSPKLGGIMQAVDERLSAALGASEPSERAVPKYLARIIDREVDDWLAWSKAHKPQKIDIDLSALGGIRVAAAKTRESLLIDEEREENAVAEEPPLPHAVATEPDAKGAPAEEGASAPPVEVEGEVESATGPLDSVQTAFLRALAQGDASSAASIAQGAHTSVDMLADAVNEALFDLVGDTVIEFAGEGPRIIEDYLEDVREVLSDEQ